MGGIEGNIKKLFFYTITKRRHYIPILSIYFLTLPNSLANQIGLYTGIGFTAGLLTESLSGYVSDILGHRKALIISSIFLFLSILTFIIPFFYGNHSLLFFIFGSIFTSLGFSFGSGTDSAFMHETLEYLGRDNEYTKVQTDIAAKASIVSMVFILLLPVLAHYLIILPFIFMLINDLVGIIVAYSLTEVGIHKIDKKERTPFWDIVKAHFGTPLMAIAFFIGTLQGVDFASNSYRSVYLADLGLPVMLIGLSMGLSRLFWYLLSFKIEKIEELLPIKNYTIFTAIINIVGAFLIFYFNNPYLVLLVIAILTSWRSGTMEIPNSYIINNLNDRKYKATVLSFKSQITSFVQIVVSFFLGYTMGIDLKFGFLVLACTITALLLINLLIINHHFRQNVQVQLNK